MTERGYDAIIIGSGMGGMTCAAYLSKLGGMKVLVLERHFKAGGQTHEFKRHGWEWDVGLHYVGAMGTGEQGRRLVDYVTDGAVQWHPMPDPYDVFHYPKFRFEVPFGQQRYQTALEARFPGEAKAIARYFQDVRRAASWMGSQMAQKAMPEWMGFFVSLWHSGGEELALQTTGAYLQAHIRDPLLRAVLASQWGDYGLVPGESSFGIHSLATGSFYSGAHYPVGGAKMIAQGFLEVLEAHGGQCLVNREVTEIVVENGQAVGVKARPARGKHSGEAEEYRAPIVISDAGAFVTFLRLLPGSVELPHRDAIASFRHGHSAVTAYLGLRQDPGRLGVSGANQWIHTSTDHDANLQRSVETLEGKPPYGFLSFPSAKDPAAHTHTAEVTTFMDYERFATWADTHWKRRPDDYEAVKRTIGEGLVELAELAVPGLSELVEYVEVSTPLSMEHFTNHPFGAFYAVPGVPEKYRQPWLDIQTPVPGLFLTGSDVASLGILGAGMGGALTAGKVMGGASMGRVMGTLRG